ncbi:MAG: hypothetical protein EP146_18340 [Oscillibacter sp.]|uniref:DnaB-like helicase N-terminal domain-containing protein n=1 Tax=Oscillibacter sp. TaxID=1945593 RepID=UPI0013209C16|nr:DnaB-like helicase N-terminal domain-containing protein [Oscillibacter sp.]MUU13084.1 hypothetical protein [Oscillibacter sp.]
MASVILAALERQKCSDRWQRDGGQYIPDPTTWLNGRRWEDELFPAEPERPTPPDDARRAVPVSEIKQDAILSQRLLDAQVGVLGSMLIDPDTVPEVLSRVRDADFAEEKYRLVFQAIQARFRAGQAIDPILVRETLGGGVDSPWTSILQGLMDVTTTAAHVDDYVDALRASVTLSNLRTLGTQLAEADRLRTLRHCWTRCGPSR